MRELGIAYVRIGEFAWSRYEPRRAEFAPGGGLIGRWKP
ncbi:beta-galactosidase [Roseiarcus sp.]